MSLSDRTYYSLIKKYNKSFVLLAFLILLSVSKVSFSQQVIFKTTLDRRQVALNEKFRIIFTVENGDAKNFQPPSFQDFYIVFGPSTSSNFQIINGRTTQSKSFSYTLQPRSVGKFTINGARAKINGNLAESNKVTIEVVSNQSKVKKSGANKNKSTGNMSEKVFLKAIVNKKDVYQGEQLVVTYKIYTRVNIVNYEMSKVPANVGFWSQNIGENNQIQLKNENIDGVIYRVATLKKEALFPQRSGTLEIDPMELKIVMRVQDKSRRRKSLFDDFFGNDPFFGGFKDIKHTLSSNKIKINVKPLPQGTKPAGFEGAVGEFKLNVTLDKTATKSNDPITVKGKISGTGNIKLLSNPELNFPPSFEVYEPKISEHVSSKGNTISGYKSFEYLAIPRLAGEYKLPPITFVYFDVKKKEYITLSSPEYVVSVSKGEGSTNLPAISGVTKEDIELIGEDIRFIHNSPPKFHKKGDYFYGSLSFFIFLSLPLIIFVSLIGYLKRHEKLMSNKALLRTRRANKIAQKRLSNAKKLLTANKQRDFYDEVSKALWGYLGDKLNIQTAELTKDKATEAFSKKNIEKELINGVMNTLDACEMALFSPIESESEMENIYNKTVRLISTLENNIK